MFLWDKFLLVEMLSQIRLIAKLSPEGMCICRFN